ncbi:MAG TPA: Ni/Fe-hydrogenase cytochrome b subunit [Acidobacteriota bacterium]|nr:Ni/Fe-hydrogenase cytochrome b subunit [Acidobacteriota bacterium]
MKTRLQLPQITWWRIFLLAVMSVGLYSTYLRFAHGLGASTALRDGFPWGLWIGFDVLCGVALAAGGFTVSAIVYIFHSERFKPIVRPTILTAFLGYLLVIVGLLFDLGHPWRIWHAIIMWNPHSVMFEVAWCVMLYTTVLALEFSPMLFERLGWKIAYKTVHRLTVPLVIMGVLLSMLHQSSLGSLFLILPGKLYPLWYSPWLPIFFFVSAIALGCAMTIFESFLSYRAFRKRLEIDLLADLAKIMAVPLALYLLLKFLDLRGRGVLHLAWEPTYEGRMFLLEIIVGVVTPLVLLLFRRVRYDEFGIFVIACLVVFGTVMNRLNVATTGLEGYAGRYFPSWSEFAVTAMIIAMGFVLFGLAVKYLRVFPAEELRAAGEGLPELPVVTALRRPLTSPALVVLVVAGVLAVAGSGLAYSAFSGRPSDGSASSGTLLPDISRGVTELHLSDVDFISSPDSPGKVTFRHGSHVDFDRPACADCHSGRFSMLSRSSLEGVDMHDEQHCGACHDGQKSFSVTDDCSSCHGN